MEQKEKRVTQTFLGKTTTGSIGPAEYDSGKFAPKESFNYGSVPFGSKSNQNEFFYQSRHISAHVSTETPGPGAYGRSLSPKDPGMHQQKTQNPGQSIGKSGMTRDNSGIRQLMTI